MMMSKGKSKTFDADVPPLATSPDRPHQQSTSVVTGQEGPPSQGQQRLRREDVEGISILPNLHMAGLVRCTATKPPQGWSYAMCCCQLSTGLVLCDVLLPPAAAALSSKRAQKGSPHCGLPPTQHTTTAPPLRIPKAGFSPKVNLRLEELVLNPVDNPLTNPSSTREEAGPGLRR